MIEQLSQIFERDLDRFADEIRAFQQEENLWKAPGKIHNSAGNLSLHIAGNLNTYIGKNIGDTGYVRDRPAEFSQKNVPRQQLITRLEETREMVSNVLGRMEESQLEEDYPELMWDSRINCGFMLVHLSGHLSYHLGQVNYLRRVLE